MQIDIAAVDSVNTYHLIYYTQQCQDENFNTQKEYNLGLDYPFLYISKKILNNYNKKSLSCCVSFKDYRKFVICINNPLVNLQITILVNELTVNNY